MSTRSHTFDVHAEEGLCSALLADPATLLAVRDIIDWRDFAGDRTKPIAQAAWACGEQATPLVVNRMNILSMVRSLGYSEEHLATNWVIQLDDAGTVPVVAGARGYAERIALLARGRRLAYRARTFADQIERAPDEAESLTEALIGGVAHDTLHAGIMRDATAAAILDEEAARPVPAFPTGFTWIDSLVGGFRPAEIWSFAGRYKGRKTTIALGLLLRALRAGISCSYIITEGTRQQLLKRLIAMLATGRMRVQGVPSAEWTLDGKGLAVDLRTPGQHEAIEWARTQIRSMPLRVYDAADNVQQLETCQTIIRRDRAMYHAQIVVVDYIQQIEPIDRRGNSWMESAFERSVKGFQNLITKEQITGLILAQRNEQTNREGGGKTAGTKGGGALVAASDFYFETDYDERATPHLMTLALRYTRYSAVGRHVYTINPSSGLVLNPLAVPQERVP